jgi:8-oxo-dGTP pyrophosphatase MutT (NUDIX family)
MHRQPLLSLLRAYNPTDPHEQMMLGDTLTFVTQHENCFERSLLEGHITGSAWIVSPDRQQVVLIHHRKLDRWFQPGGHADGNPDVAAVALQEAQEETGLQTLSLIHAPGESSTIFDVDVHPIPERGNVPTHLHYDIRFLIQANPHEPFGYSDEIKDVCWVYIKEIIRFSDEESIKRMAHKTLMSKI